MICSRYSNEPNGNGTDRQVKVFILDNLYRSLPRPPFTEPETEEIAARVYDHVWQRSASGQDLVARSCCGSAPIRTPGLTRSPGSDPDSASPPGGFRVYAILQIASADGGFKAPQPLASRSQPHCPNWSAPKILCIPAVSARPFSASLLRSRPRSRVIAGSL